MLTTHRLFEKVVEKEYLQKDHNTLALKYKQSVSEYERSQIVGAIFLKSFEMMLRESNKYTYDSGDKAEMMMEEILSSLQEWDGEKSSYFTYLTVKVKNRLLWEYTSKRRKQNRIEEMCSVSLDENVKYSDCDEGNTYSELIEDKNGSERFRSREFMDSMYKMFEDEIQNREYDAEFRIRNKQRKQTYRESSQYVVFLRDVFNVLCFHPEYTSDQIARVLGLIVKDKNGNIRMVQSRRSPDVYYDYVRDSSGNPIADKWGRKILTERRVEDVPLASYNKIFSAKSDLQELMRLYGIVR